MRLVVVVLAVAACGGSGSAAAIDASHGGSGGSADAAGSGGVDARDLDAAPGIDARVFDGPPGDGSGSAAATQVLRINEVTAAATNCDLVELRAIAGGDLTGLRLVERKDIVFEFPAMTVAPDALIVVHFGAAAGGPCANGVSGNETATPTDHPHAQFAANYDGAYDLFSTDAGLAATNNVISVMKTTTVIDAVLLASAATGIAAGDSEDQAAIVAAQHQWVKVGGGVPAGGFIDDDFSANAALNLGATVDGTSIQRLDDTDDNDKADWNSATATTQPSTWGALNAGQSPLP